MEARDWSESECDIHVTRSVTPQMDFELRKIFFSALATHFPFLSSHFSVISNGNYLRLVHPQLGARLFVTNACVWQIFRSLKLEPGKAHEFKLFDPEDEAQQSVVLKLTNASLGLDLADQNARTALKITHTSLFSGEGSDEEDEDDEPKIQETILCVLTPGKVRFGHSS
jgi:hypothetical protein